MNQIERRKFKTMNSVKLKQPVSIYNDPWESYNDVKEHGQLTLRTWP
ncbi:radical SAM/CxCxxxxC motif protein YfkAB, partial [Staphylococcus aureus]|nr:radical SAM/CxCxxxxC motif protein YfkAB [Staphylococcus aureus]MBR9372681.1 radical SAM/CxCxxxxC motif protein YfkAB [Staphylococcus aureus]